MGELILNTVGLDIGRRNVKLFTGHRYIHFPSVVSEWRDIKLESSTSSRSFSGVFAGEKFFVGELAENEGEYRRQLLVDDKATMDAKLLALVSLHQAQLTDYDVVTSIPVENHDPASKQSLIDLLRGNWSITVNGVERVVNIHRVRVAPEGGAAFWSNPIDGLVRLVDGGSKTINYITMKDRRYIDRDSGTLGFGFDTNRTINHMHLATRAAGELGKKWGKDDLVLTVGGEAESLAKHLQPYFPKVRMMYSSTKPSLQDGVIDLNMFANAVGNYNIGKAV